MCVKKIPSLAHLYFEKFANECQVQNRPILLLVLSTRINRLSHQQQRFRIFYQFSASRSAIRLVEIPFCQVKCYQSTFTLFCNRYRFLHSPNSHHSTFTPFCKHRDRFPRRPFSLNCPRIVTEIRTYIHQAHFSVG